MQSIFFPSLNLHLVLEQQFEEFYPQLMTTIRVSGEQLLALKDSQQKAQLIDFLKRFKQIYKKEFFADNLTSILLRDLFVSLIIITQNYLVRYRRHWRRGVRGAKRSTEPGQSLQCRRIHVEAEGEAFHIYEGQHCKHQAMELPSDLLCLAQRDARRPAE